LLVDTQRPELCLFIGLFTGLWIKVVLSFLNEAGRKFLPARLQDKLSMREEAAESVLDADATVLRTAAAKLLPQAWEQVKQQGRPHREG
jgi:hypothetical protein